MALDNLPGSGRAKDLCDCSSSWPEWRFVKPEAVSVLAGGHDARLTLVSCLSVQLHRVGAQTVYRKGALRNGFRHSAVNHALSLALSNSSLSCDRSGACNTSVTI
jgi:hypothetical protein